MRDGQSLIGFNAHLPYIRDWALFINRMQALNPALMVAYIDNMNDAPLVTRLQAIIPDTLIVARLYHPQDGAFHLKRADGAEWVASPVDTINWLQDLGNGGQFISLLNEPGTGENTLRLTTWLRDCMAIASGRGKRLAVANFSTGTPAIENGQWVEAFDALLRSISGTEHALCVHEYLPGEPYRVGRLLTALKRCEKLNIAPPQIFVTEFGVDTEGGIFSGYRSRGWAGDVYAGALCEVARRVYLPLAQSGVFGGAAVFSYGNSGGWEAFDVEGDQAFFDALMKLTPRYKAIVPVKPPPAPVAPPPSATAEAIIAELQAKLNELKAILLMKRN